MNESDLHKDYLSVKDFSQLVSIPESRLKYYDRKGIFVPDAHGEGRQKKYRYYSPTQITTVKMIRVLSEIGVPLAEISELSKDRTPEKILKMLAKNRRILSEEINYLQDVYSIVSTFSELLVEGISAEENEITVCEMPEIPIVLGDVTNFYEGENFIREFLSFCATPRRPKLNLSFPVGGFFNDMDTFLHRPSEPSRFFSLDPKGHDRRDKGLYLIAYTRGYYGQTNDMPQRMAEHAKKNGLVFDGPVYNIYLFDEVSTFDTENYLLQAAAAVHETNHRFSRHPHRHFKNAQEAI